MSLQHEYQEPGPTRDEVDATREPTVVEFGADWCGYCQAARTPIEQAMAQYPEVRHIRVADGPGRPLGRSFRVKLWPTLIFLRDGQEQARVVRPTSEEQVREALGTISAREG